MLSHRHCILVPFSASTSVLKRLNSLKALDFNFNIDTHISREKSSKIRRKYLLPPNVDGVIGPHISIYTSSRGCEARNLEILGNGL